MGTNYYHKTNTCSECQRNENKHIGKSSIGWTFSFRGHENIRSYKAWLKILESGGDIYDEYGDPISLEGFKNLVEVKKTSNLNHAVECPSGNWLDDENNSFSGAEFC